MDDPEALIKITILPWARWWHLPKIVWAIIKVHFAVRRAGYWPKYVVVEGTEDNG